MGSGDFLETLATRRKVNVDTGAFVYYLQREARYRPLVEGLFRLAADERLEVVVSAIVQIELLVQPMRRGVLSEVETVLELTEQYPGVSVVEVSRPVVMAAAALRARTRLRVPDAIVLATGIVEGCDATIGNDAGCQRAARGVEELHILSLDAPLPVPAYLRFDDFASLA